MSPRYKQMTWHTASKTSIARCLIITKLRSLGLSLIFRNLRKQELLRDILKHKTRWIEQVIYRNMITLWILALSSGSSKIMTKSHIGVVLRGATHKTLIIGVTHQLRAKNKVKEISTGTNCILKICSKISLEIEMKSFRRSMGRGASLLIILVWGIRVGARLSSQPYLQGSWRNVKTFSRKIRSRFRINWIWHVRS